MAVKFNIFNVGNVFAAHPQYKKMNDHKINIIIYTSSVFNNILDFDRTTAQIFVFIFIYVKILLLHR